MSRALAAASRCNFTDIRSSAAGSIFTPASSMRASTGMRGRSISSYTEVRPWSSTSLRSALASRPVTSAASARLPLSFKLNLRSATSDKAGARTSLVGLRAMLGVLGLDPLAPPWPGARGGSDDRLRQVVGALVKLTLQQRDAARARRDYATSDAIRDGLEQIGIVVEDTGEGPRWELKR